MNAFADPADIRGHLQRGIEVAQRALYAPEAEQAVLGAAMAAPALFLEAVEATHGSHFGNPAAARVWATLAEMIKAGQTVSPYLVSDRLGADADFGAWGGLTRLEDLAECASTVGIAENLALILDRSGRRSMDGLLKRVGAMVLDTASGDVPSLVGELERGCALIANNVTAGDRWIDAGDMLEAALEAALQRRGEVQFTFGIEDLDRMAGGLSAGETTVIGAWTGMGKTLGGQAIARANAVAGKGTCYFSLEMGDYPMAHRLAVDLMYDRLATTYAGLTSNITIQQAMKGNLQAHEIGRYRDAIERVRRMPLLFDTRPGLTVSQMEAAARRAHRKWEKAGIEPGPIFFDHIGKIAPSKNRRGDKTAEISDISDEIAGVAKRLRVPCVPLCQLNRGVEAQGEDKRPQLAHLKQSSAIAEDARQVIFIYRPEYYYRDPMEHEDFDKKADRLAKLEKVRHHFYWVVDKNSNGPKGQVKSFCEAECAAVRDWEVVR